MVIQSNGDLAAVVQGNGQTDRTGNQVTTNTTLVRESSSVGVGNGSSTLGDRRASAVRKSTANLHTLDGKTGILGLNSGDVEARPARVGGRPEVKFTPGGGVATIAVGGDRVLSGSPATLGIGSKGVVLGRSGGEGEAVTGVAVPAVHLAVGADLVPDYDLPVVGVGALELHDVLVAAGFGAGDLDDVAAVGAADVANISVSRAGGLGRRTESIGAVLAAGGDRGPVGTGTG